MRYYELFCCSSASSNCIFLLRRLSKMKMMVQRTITSAQIPRKGQRAAYLSVTKSKGNVSYNQRQASGVSRLQRRIPMTRMRMVLLAVPSSLEAKHM